MDYNNDPNNGGVQNNYNNFNTEPPEEKGLSIASLVLGILSFIACCIPIVGYPVEIVAIILGVIGMKKGGRTLAIIGIVCAAIALVLTIINSVAGAMIATSGYLDSFGL